jgi:hypothetical protein
MATAKDYADWIVKNPDKKGTPEFDTVAKAYQAAKSQQEPPKLSATDVAVGAAENFFPSVGGMISDAYQAVRHPSETLGNMKDVALGLIQKARNLDPVEFRGSEPAFDESKANALGQMLKDHYGGVEEVKRTIATDPASILADVSTVFTGGGTVAARLPGIVGKVGRAVETTGRMIEPIGATAKATGAVVKAVPREMLGFTTGAGGRAIEEAAKAGAEGGEQAKAFRGNIRGTVSPIDVVNQAKSSLNAMRAERSKAYNSGMVDIKSDASVLDMKPILEKVDEVRSRGIYKGKVIDESAAEAWDKINKAVSDWNGSNPAEFHTPEGLDALKKKISDIRDSQQFGTPAYNAAKNVTNSIKDQIVAQAPTYAGVMKDYSEASDLLSQMEGALSLGNKAQADTALRKLQSLLRNNVQTNYGRRAELGDILATKGADTMYPALAGQALGSVMPRAISGQGSLIGGGMAALGSAKIAPMLALTSPRLMGEAAYYTGKVAGSPQRLAKMLGEYGDKLAQSNPQMGFLVDYAKRAKGAIDPTIARLLVEQLGRMQQLSEQQ